MPPSMPFPPGSPWREDFVKHSAVEAAVHKELVRTGLWPAELGNGFSRLFQLRSRGDYGGGRHVSPADTAEAIRIAAEILQAVARDHPDEFRLAPDRKPEDSGPVESDQG